MISHSYKKRLPKNTKKATKSNRETEIKKVFFISLEKPVSIKYITFD